MSARPIRSPVVVAVLAATVVAAVAGIAWTWVSESRRDLVADVPGLGKFVIRDPADFIQGQLFQRKAWEPEVVPVFQKYIKAGSGVADIGAYNGVHTVRFANLVGPTGHVYAFEPNPSSFDMLKANIALNHLGDRVVTYPYGLAEKASTAKLVTTDSHNQGATNACSEDDVREHRRDCDQASHGETSMIRVDDDVAKWFPTRVSFVKIDVEGYENRVLSGAKAWLARDRPVIWIEIWPDPVRQKFKMALTVADTIALIQSLGYRLEFLMQPWNYLFVPTTAEGAPR
jgi:FkbM family methyltransferase